MFITLLGPLLLLSSVHAKGHRHHSSHSSSHSSNSSYSYHPHYVGSHSGSSGSSNEEDEDKNSWVPIIIGVSVIGFVIYLKCKD